MTMIHKITLGLNIAALIISTFAIVKSYRAMKMSKKILEDSNRELENLRDKWSIDVMDEIDDLDEINEDDYIDAW